VALDPATGAEIQLELTVVFAGVEATAMSGECTPVLGDPCIPVPAGANPSVVLQNPSTDPPTEIVSGTFPDFTIEDGAELVVLATTDDAMMPTIEAGPFGDGFACAETDPFPDMLETKSARYDVRSQLSLRTQQNPARARFMRKTVAAGLGR
jgi:hypothetical protein